MPSIYQTAILFRGHGLLHPELYASAVGAYSDSLDDSVATSEDWLDDAAGTATRSESTATSESLTGIGAGSATRSDSVTSSENLTGVGVTASAPSDSVASSESLSGVAAFVASVGDSITTTASPVGELGTLSLSESAATSDNLTAISAATGSLTDSISPSESLTGVGQCASAPADSVTVSESLIGAGAGSATLGFSRASEATYFDASGVLQTAGVNVPRPDYSWNGSAWVTSGTLIESATTNGVRNARLEGASAPSIFPTNWVSFTGSSGSIATTVSGVGTEDGLSYVDVHFVGTSSGNGFYQFGFEAGNVIAASLGQTFAASLYAKLTTGSLPGGVTSVVQVNENDSSGNGLVSSSTGFSATGSDLSTQRYSNIAATGNGGVAFVQPFITILFTGAIAMDFTLRLAGPQIELGSSASSLVLPPIGSPGASTRAAEAGEAIVVSDSLDIVSGVALADTVATSDTLSGVGAASASRSDSHTTSESLSGAGSGAASPSDNASTSDTIPQLAASLSLSDTIVSSETLAGAGAATPSVSDSVATSDSIPRLAASLSLADTITSSESLSGLGAASASLSESVSSSDSFTVSASSFSLADTTSSSENLSGSGASTASRSDSATSSDSLSALAFGLSLADTPSTSESLTGVGVATGTVGETSTSGDSLIIAGGVVSDVVATSDSFVVTNASLSRTDSSTSSETLSPSLSASASISDSVTVSEALAVTAVSLLLADTVVPTDSLSSPSTSSSLSDSTATATNWTPIAASTPLLTDSTSSTDNTPASAADVGSTSDIVTASDQVLATAFTRSLSDNISSSEILSALVAPTANLNDSHSASDNMTGAFSSAITLTDAGLPDDEWSGYGSGIDAWDSIALSTDLVFIQANTIDEVTLSSDELLALFGLAPTLAPIQPGRDVLVPSFGRRVIAPPRRQTSLLLPTPYFDPMDAADIDLFAFDFSVAAFPGDPMVSVIVTSDPATLTIGQTIVLGTSVQVFIGPAHAAPLTYSITAHASFASGRTLDCDVELSTEAL